MSHKLEIVIIEDDVRASQDLEILISEREDEFVLVGTTADAPKGIQLVEQYAPDVVILDIELHRGVGSGLDFLKDLHASGISAFPFVLVTTNNISQIVHDMARTLGADLIMTKNEPDYSAKMVLDALAILKPAIEKKRHPYVPEDQIKESIQHHNKRIREKVTNDLLKLGVNPKDVGFQYLVEGIMMSRNGYVVHLCNAIAQKFSKTEPSVERAMQNAINRTWSTGDIEVLEQNYTARIRSERAVPTITEFVSYYANRYKSTY